MLWIAPSEKDTANGTLEKRLWSAADQFRANSGLTAAQYSQPVLGLIFLRFAEVRFAAQRAKLEKTVATSRRGCAWTTPERITPRVCSTSHLTHASTICSRYPRPPTLARPSTTPCATSR